MDYSYTKNGKLGTLQKVSPEVPQANMNTQEFAQYQTDLRAQQSLNQGFIYNENRRWAGNGSN
jgi:hypothetical protein